LRSKEQNSFYERLLAEKDARIAELQSALEFERCVSSQLLAASGTEDDAEPEGRRPETISFQVCRSQFGECWPLMADEAAIIVDIRPDAEDEWTYLKVAGVTYPISFDAYCELAQQGTDPPKITAALSPDINTKVAARVRSDWDAIATQVSANPEQRDEIWARLGPDARLRAYRQLLRRIKRKAAGTSKSAE
jgi:hypothetical protein